MKLTGLHHLAFPISPRSRQIQHKNQFDRMMPRENTRGIAVVANR
ncbi:hypothetical protein [Mariniradius sediminis]|nr:hypothetical protein [Mariniradius sediminis]